MKEKKLVRKEKELVKLNTLKKLLDVVDELKRYNENLYDLYVVKYDKKCFLIPDIFKKTKERLYTNIDIESPEESEKFSSVYPYIQPFQECPVIIFTEYDEDKENIISIDDIPENVPLSSDIKTIAKLYNCEYIIPAFEPAILIEEYFYKIVETNEEEAKEEL